MVLRRVVEECVGDIDRMVGAALQIVDHICKEDAAHRVTFVIHQTLDVIVYKVGLQIIHILLQPVRFRQFVKIILCKNTEGVVDGL